MKNKHFLNLNLPIAELNNLDELTLLAHIMLLSHSLDRILSREPQTINIDLKKTLEKLITRLDIYKEKYDVNCNAYKWAVKIKELCEKSINFPTEYAYPFDKKSPIKIENNEFEKLIKGRRSIRTYTGQGISDDEIMKILECATWAPSNCHEQALRYIVIKNDINKSLIKRSGIDIKNSACVIAVIADLRLYCDADIECACHDSGAAVQNILLTCHYFGFGSCYLSDISLNSDNMHSIFNIKEYEKVTALVSIGHYDKVPITRERININKLVIFC